LAGCPGFSCLLESPEFLNKISRTWKVLENEFGPEKSWTLKFELLESPGIYLWFQLIDMPNIYRIPCVNKCIKYSFYVAN